MLFVLLFAYIFYSYFIDFINIIYSVMLSIHYFIVYLYNPLIIMLLLNTICHRRKKLIKRPVFLHLLDSDNKVNVIFFSY